MKSIIKISFLLLFLYSCKEQEKPAIENNMPENGMDAAGKFLRAALDGDYKTVRVLSINDSINKQLLDISEWKYKNELTPEDKKSYKDASIRLLNETHKINDSLTIVHYSNSFRNKHDSLKVIRLNGQWFIDLNFAFQKNDSLPS